MNPIERVIRRVDAAQQRHRASAFAVGVVKKYGDDNGGILAASLAHTSFVTMFPLLLIFVTVLGLITSGDPALQHQVLRAVGNQVPLIGHQLTTNVHQLRKSSLIGLVVGLVTLAWGCTGLAQSGLFTMAQVWNLPGPQRPGYLQRLARAGLFLGVLGLGVVVTTLLSVLSAYGSIGAIVTVLVEVLAVVTNIGMYLIGFRVLTPKSVSMRALVPGAVAGGIVWTVLQALGTYLVGHLLHINSAYTVFATVLGLLGWIYISVQIVVYSAELNVVLARRLWPRSIVQPPLTKADRLVLADQALQNQRREDQRVDVSFDVD
jgi:YihY family inner membrane protein